MSSTSRRRRSTASAPACLSCRSWSPSRKKPLPSSGTVVAGGVQQDRAAASAVRALEDVADRARVLLRRPAAQLLDRAVRDAELALRIELALAHRSADDLAEEVGPDWRQLVDPARAVNDE